MALTAALLGWMFDGAEMGVFSMVGRPALIDLLSSSTSQNPVEIQAQVGLWFGVVTAGFLVGAATGGVLFGWLGDRIGRVRAMMLSVLTYAVFTGLCGLATGPLQMGVLRFIAALGMGGEWSLGVALVMEVWPNRSRAFMAGLIGAAANVGYLIVGAIGLGLSAYLNDLAAWLSSVGVAQQQVDRLVSHQGWRVLMMLGATPALLTFLIRLFVPESPRWERERKSGATSFWQSRDLLGVVIGAAGPALMIYLWAWPHGALVRLAGSAFGLLVAAAGYTYPVLRYLQRQAGQAQAGHRQAGSGHRDDLWPTLGRMWLGAGLSGVALLGTWGAIQWAPSWADQIGPAGAGAKEYTQMALAVGAIVGTILAALMGDWFGRRTTYALLCVASFASLLLFYQGNTEYGRFFLSTAFLAGACTASFYGWLPLYLPELFHTSMRATGQGFGFNFGRILAAVGALQAGNLFAPKIEIAGRVFQGGYPLACSIMGGIYLLGLLLIAFAPETKGRLPE